MGRSNVLTGSGKAPDPEFAAKDISDAAKLDNLATLVRRLARACKQHSHSVTLVNGAMDLLDRYGLSANILRSDEGAAAPTPVEAAMETLRRAMHDDPGYAWAWHCNIAVPMQVSHAASNAAAAAFMNLCFGVDTSREPSHGAPEDLTAGGG